MRKPAVANAFYPGNKEEIKEMVTQFMENVPKIEINGKLKAIIVPHAGWTYSGQVAAYAFSLVKEANKKRIILLGPSHQVYMDEIIADDNDYWETPLGKVKLIENDFTKREQAHAMDHCLEVQVPFLQLLLDDFEIMPLLTGDLNPKEESDKIMKLLDQDTLLIISSDLSHFYDYEAANKLDEKTNKAILNLQPEKLTEACGKTPILILLEIAKKLNWKVKQLCYKNSGDVTGDKTRVVGYSSFAFYE